jgi:Concanavalin A-like lectin/glucanases superfamily/Immunoglobulin domain
MRIRLLSGTCLFLAGIISLFCTCKELPTNPYENGENLEITMFISGDLLEMNAWDSVSVGLVVNIPSLVKKLTVVQGDDQKELTVPLNRPESSQSDTVYFRTMYKLTGKKELTVKASLTDNIIKEFPFAIRVLDASSSLWKQDTLTIKVAEDTTISYSLLTLLKNPLLTNVVFSSPDTGVTGTNWKYTIPRGAASKDTISLFASIAGSEKSVLKVLLVVSPKDTEGPVIKLLSPAQDRSKIAQSTVKFVIICKDENGISAVNYTFGSLSGAMTKDNDNTYSATLANLVKGDNQITVVATDGSSKKNVNDTVFTIVYDPTIIDTVSKNIAPNFDIDTIRATIITSSQYFLNLKDTCFDSNGDALSYSLVTPSKGSITTTTYGYTPSDSDVGTQTVTLIARDFELSDTLTIIFTVKRDDTDPPSVTFTPSLGDTLFSSDTTYTISLKALDASGINRVEVSSDTKNPSKVIMINDSVWDIKVSSLGSVNAVPVIITIFDKSPRANIFKDTAIIKYKPTDKDKPEIRITSQVKDTVIINKSTCEVTLTCRDASGIQSVTASNGITSISVISITDSVYTSTITNVPSDRFMPISFTVTDRSTNANVSTKTIYLKYDPTGTDTTAPSVTFKNPAADNAVIGTSSVTIDIFCTDDNGVASLICEYGGKTYLATKSANNIFSATIPGLVKGANIVKVTATDGSTNANVKPVSLTINYDPTLLDITGPSITLPGLTDNKTVASSSITFTAECSDINQVANVQCSFGGNTFTVRNAGDVYSVTVTGLNSGMTNVITLTATDGSTNANKTVKTIAVKYDPTLNDTTGPAITLVNPTNSIVQINTDTITATVSIKDEYGVASVTATFNSKQLTVTNTKDSLFHVKLTGLRQNIYDTIIFSSIDKSSSSNVSKLQILIKYVANPPTITVQPKSQTLYTGDKLTLSVTGSSSLPLIYQWYKNNSLLPDANQPTYTINSALISDNGEYYATVSDGTSEVQSSKASITILSASEITAQWHFDETSGLTAQNAVSINNNLTFESEPARISTENGKAVVLSSNAGTAPASSNFFPKVITIEARVRINAFPVASNRSMIVSTVDWNPTTYMGYELRLAGDQGLIELSVGTGPQWLNIISTKTLKLNTWYTIAGQCDGTTLSLFVDGMLWASTPYAGYIAESNVGLGIGKRVIDQPLYFSGAVDEVTIYKETRYH